MDVDEQRSLTAAPHTNTPRIKALQPDGSTSQEPTFDVQHVARVVVHIASLPLEVTVLEMNIMYEIYFVVTLAITNLIARATGMPYVGRG
jgi:hypothetical protein